MQQLVTISFAIKNTTEEKTKIVKCMNMHFSIPIKVEPTNESTTNTSVKIEEALREEFVIIHREDLIELQKNKHVLKDLLGTIETLNNKLKQICDDIRTISES